MYTGAACNDLVCIYIYGMDVFVYLQTCLCNTISTVIGGPYTLKLCLCNIMHLLFYTPPVISHHWDNKVFVIVIVIVIVNWTRAAGAASRH